MLISMVSYTPEYLCFYYFLPFMMAHALPAFSLFEGINALFNCSEIDLLCISLRNMIRCAYPIGSAKAINRQSFAMFKRLTRNTLPTPDIGS